MIRKICFVTGGRADYGLLRLLMREIQKSRQFQLQIIATGSHFLPKFGSTYREILGDRFQINARVNIRPTGDSAVAVGEAMGLGVRGISRALAKLRPDLLVLLGDRYEILAAAIAATLAAVPIAHLHGGELTEGAYDDAFRHAITKMAHLHFVSAAIYRKRIIQLGESPSRVFKIGALGVDNVLSQKFFSREELEQLLRFKFSKKNILITFHPTTLESGKAGRQADALLKALRAFPETGMIFTMPGADRESGIIWKKFLIFVRRNPRAKAFRSLGSRAYLSLMKEADAVVGNSSSGLLEAPSFRIPVINIGNRQHGRVRATNVIDCEPDSASIKRSIQKTFSLRFKTLCAKMTNPLGKGGATIKFLKILKNHRKRKISIKKVFHDK